MEFLQAEGTNTSITMSHKLSAEIPSSLRPASDEIVFASVLLCDTAVCFLQVQRIGTNGWIPEMHSVPSDVVESVGPPAKLASWTRPNLHVDAEFPHDNHALFHVVEALAR